MKPEFLLSVLVTPRNPTDRAHVLDLLGTAATGNDALHIGVEDAGPGLVVGGLSEEILAKVMQSIAHAGIAVSVGPPKVAYRETISRVVTVSYTYKKMVGGEGQFALVEISVEPRERDAGLAFLSAVDSVPAPYLAAARRGIDLVLAEGILIGFPVVDLKVALRRLIFHETDSSEHAFEIAARHALRQGLADAGPLVLEPIMQVRVTAQAKHAEAVARDLRSRRAASLHRSRESAHESIAALVPLANMFGYSTALAAISGGTASFLVAYSHYQPLPGGGDGQFPTAAAKRA